ncbi:hypothetical protein BKA82DRAFT_1006592, partial [Pisolithus tinctorius]
MPHRFQIRFPTRHVLLEGLGSEPWTCSFHPLDARETVKRCNFDTHSPAFPMDTALIRWL